jgi:ankyrin repeat protein
VARYLVEKHGLEMDAVNYRGNSPLWLASAGGHMAVVQWLADLGAEVNEFNFEGVEPAWVAYKSGHFAVAQFLYAAHGASPLWLACLMGNLEEVQRLAAVDPALLTKGDQLDIQPMWISALTGRLDIMQYLVGTFGLEPNVKNKTGMSAFCT